MLTALKKEVKIIAAMTSYTVYAIILVSVACSS